MRETLQWSAVDFLPQTISAGRLNPAGVLVLGALIGLPAVVSIGAMRNLERRFA